MYTEGSEGGKEGSTDKAITRGWATDAHNETIRGPRARLFFFFFIPPPLILVFTPSAALRNFLAHTDYTL